MLGHSDKYLAKIIMSNFRLRNVEWTVSINIRFFYSTLKKAKILNKCFTKPARTIARFPLFYCFLKFCERTFSFNFWGYQSPNFDTKKEADSIPWYTVLIRGTIKCLRLQLLPSCNLNTSLIIWGAVSSTVLYNSMARTCIFLWWIETELFWFKSCSKLDCLSL